MERLGGILERLGAVLERLGGILERLGAVLESSWSVLERLGGVLKRLGALLQATWPDAENAEKPLVSFVFGALAALGSVLEASWSVLEASWRRLGAVLELLLLPMLPVLVFLLLRSALGPLLRRFWAILHRSQASKISKLAGALSEREGIIDI